MIYIISDVENENVELLKSLHTSRDNGGVSGFLTSKGRRVFPRVGVEGRWFPLGVRMETVVSNQNNP